MSEKRTKAEKLEQQIEKTEKEIDTLPDETVKRDQDANKQPSRYCEEWPTGIGSQ